MVSRPKTRKAAPSGQKVAMKYTSASVLKGEYCELSRPRIGMRRQMRPRVRRMGMMVCLKYNFCDRCWRRGA